MGNRGVAPDRAFEILMSSIRDENVNVRYWAVEGLAYLGIRAAGFGPAVIDHHGRARVIQLDDVAHFQTPRHRCRSSTTRVYGSDARVPHGSSMKVGVRNSW